MTSRYDTWKLGLNDSYFDDPTYWESDFRYDRKSKMWRDVDTGRFVGKKKPKD